MPTVVATAGFASANSYITVADATTYFDERLRVSAWSNEDADDKGRALIMATRRLDQEEYAGEKSDTAQALKWPRMWAVDDDGNEYAGDAIPEMIEHATCELALLYLAKDDDGTDEWRDTGLEQFDAARVGSLNFTRDQSFKAGQLPQHIRRLLRPVIVTAGNSVAIQRA